MYLFPSVKKHKKRAHRCIIHEQYFVQPTPPNVPHDVHKHTNTYNHTETQTHKHALKRQLSKVPPDTDPPTRKTHEPWESVLSAAPAPRGIDLSASTASARDSTASASWCFSRAPVPPRDQHGDGELDRMMGVSGCEVLVQIREREKAAKVLCCSQKSLALSMGMGQIGEQELETKITDK